MSDSIKVAIKVRPLIKREKDENLPIQWIVQGNSIVSTDPEMKRRGDGGFCFDHIFDVNTSNLDVFDTIVKPIVNASVNGFNGTVFAYGQTSSGKTYTMMGTAEEPGIVPLTIRHMFDAITNTMGREFLLRVSYLEIYNEKVNDLLNKSGTDLKIKEDGNGQVILKCKEEITNCPENVLSIMKKGDKNRRIGETNMNERSSRSHTIFRITIESREAGGDSDGAIQVSQLNLVDLAGSERARQTGATGERFKEGRHINMSLSTLGLVIMQLSELQDGQKHVNFRDSKLTRLLQTSLGGNAMTAIICAVTPAALEETQCSLSFASRAKSVKTKPQVNEVMSDAALLKRYAKQLTRLQEELEKIKTENRVAEVEEMESKLQEKERINQLLEERIELLKTRIVSGDNTNQEESFRCKSKRRQTWGGPGMFNQHLPVFHTKPNLPTIKEVSFEKPHGKSIIQSMDIMNQTFQTAFTDFELELFESERARESAENVSDSDEEIFITKRKNHVTFKDDLFTIKSRNSSFDVTPEKYDTSTQTVNHQNSPSTPKHVLRRCIIDLTREFVELREFTTLEKQLICQRNCSSGSEERQCLQDLTENDETKLAPKCQNVEYSSEIKERLASLNLLEEKNLDRVITELCLKLNQVERQNVSEKEENQKTTKQISELKKEIVNITSERNEFEYISRELRAELKKKTTELEWKVISEESIRQEETKKVSELEKQIEDITLERNKAEQINAESTKNIAELQKQIQCIISERDEFENLRQELRVELNKKCLELEELKDNLEGANAEIINDRIRKLEIEIENVISEKNHLEHTNVELRAELNRMSSEYEFKIASEQAEKQKAVEKVSELEKRIEQIIIEKNKQECENIEQKVELKRKISDSELKIECEQTVNQGTMEKVSELEKEIESITVEKNELARVNKELGIELDRKVSELKEKMMFEEMEYEKTREKIAQLEIRIEGISAEKKEYERVNAELRVELDKKISEMDSIVTSNEVNNRKAMELEQQIVTLISEKNEHVRVNNELRAELEQKISESKEKMMFEEMECEKTREKIAQLEIRIDGILAEKDEYERVNAELRVELDKKISEMDSIVTSNEVENRKTMEAMSELQQQITNLISEKNELNCVIKMDQKASELEMKMMNQSEYEKATGKIAELEDQITSMTAEINELENINKELQNELNQNTCALKERMTFEHLTNQKVMDMIAQLEVENQITSSEDEFVRIVSELRAELNKKTSELTSEQIERRKAVEKISELNEKIESIVSERNQLEHLNNRLNVELDEKISKFHLKTASEQIANVEATRKISELEKQIESTTSEKNNVEYGESSKKELELELKGEVDYIDKDNTMEDCTKDLQEAITNLQAENQNLRDQLGNQSVLSYSRFTESVIDTSDLITNMETEKSQLMETLQLKSYELEDIKGDVQSLKTDIKKLQETICLLTTENMEMATKLTTEQENMKQTEFNLQKTIDELYMRISEVTNEKISLESDLTVLNSQLESMRSQVSAMNDEEQLFASYRSKIDKLTAENIELSAFITEKNKELENIKESKSLLYEHECIYKEKVAILTEKNESLVSENNELSSDLIDKIEENDMLKEQCNIFKNKIEQSLAMNENITETDMECLKTENNTLKAEIAELKMKITILSEENVKYSSNLLEAMENLDSYNNTLHLSTVFNDTAEIGRVKQEIPEEETRQTLACRLTALQSKIDHLTHLNKKLSDLKLTSCSQCAHLRNLNESRRAFKLEAKILNKKLEDLQRKFDRKCADTEILKNRINQELNSSELDVSLNVSFVDEMNVSFVEEKIRSLNDELQTLKADHNKLSIQYEDKCNELEQLQNDVIANAPCTNSDSTPKKSTNKNPRIDQIQNYIDQLRNNMDELKKGSMNFTNMLNQFRTEKANLLSEIVTLKDVNEELQQKLLDNESTAGRKVQILETELANMGREVEQFSTRMKESESQRLMLEVELESLKVDEQQKSNLIGQLNERISSLKSELDLVTRQKNDLTSSSTIENEKQLQHLKEHSEQLEKETKQREELEQNSTLKIKELEISINDCQRNIANQESFSRELQEKSIDAEQLLEKRERENLFLTQKLQAAENELVELKNNLEVKYRNEFDSMFQQYQQHIKESENNLQKLNDRLNAYVVENSKLTEERNSLLKTVAEREHVFDQQKTLTNDKEKLNAELNDVKNSMIKELNSLNCNTSDYSTKSINEIFTVLLQTLVSKEEEIIKSLHETYDKEKRKLEDEKEQCLNTEKRATMWAKELEADIEKLQAELTEREHVQKEYKNKISQLENLLKESRYDKEMFKEKLEALQMDYSNLQIDFDRRCKVDIQQEEAIIIAHKKEKEVQEIFKNKEIELKTKLKAEIENLLEERNELVCSLNVYTAKITDLESTIENYNASEKHLKDTIDGKETEIKRKIQHMEKMNAELEQVTQAYNKVSQEIEQKDSYIEEIKFILKDKCDMLSEYKTKLETIIPEYDMLKEHVIDQKLMIERFKEEIETLKKEREEHLEVIKSKLNTEEIKNAGLSKQLHELNNRNTALIEELNDLKEKYEELEQANIKLERKIRNSTSKIKAETEIEELKELNTRLQNNLEGASNRVAELQDIKNKTLKELVDLKGVYEFVLQENIELKKSLLSYKTKHSISNSLIDEGKYDLLLLEKNKIALELEGKKIILNQKDKELKEYISQMQLLTVKNKELDEEVEEYATIIRERDAEISKLEEKLYSRLTENTLINELEEKLRNVNEENEKLQDNIEALKMRLQMDVEKDIKLLNEKNIHALVRENSELRIEIGDYKKQIKELKEINQQENSNGKAQDNLEGACNQIKELEEEKNRLTKELEAQKLMLNEKDKDVKEYMNKVRDFATKNKELNNELEKYAAIIRNRDADILKLGISFDSLSTEKEVNDMKSRIEFTTTENKRLKCEIRELQMRSRFDVHNEKNILMDSARKQQKVLTYDKDLREYQEKCEQLKKQIQELELQLVSKNGKIATLEIQIQSQNFPYQRKCKELEELVLAFRNKNAELSSEVRKLQRTMNDVNTWECDVCRRWRVNRKDQACQTIPDNLVRFRSVNSGVVEDHVKIQKLEKEKILMKDLCRSRYRRIKELECRIKELEEAQSSLTSRSNEVLQDKSNQQCSNVTYFSKYFDFEKDSKS
ncbi:Centromere-associated protein E [Anthophora quadrimaculata]